MALSVLGTIKCGHRLDADQIRDRLRVFAAGPSGGKAAVTKRRIRCFVARTLCVQRRPRALSNLRLICV